MMEWMAPLRHLGAKVLVGRDFPQWKIDLVRDALTLIEGEMGGPVTAATIAKRIPSLSMADIQKAMKYLEAQRRLARS